MKYTVRFTKSFKKDLKKAEKQGRNLDLLWDVVEKLSNGETLDASYLDHPLKGKYINSRECHIEPDWLLIYAIRGDVLVLALNRLGTHSELFKK